MGRFLDTTWIVIAASVLLAACGGSDHPGSVIFEDDYPASDDGWPVADDQNVLLELAEDGYHVVLKNTDRPHASWLTVSDGERTMTVEADATLADDPGGAESRESWGVTCSSLDFAKETGPTRGGVSYFFYLTSDGLWAIGREGASGQAYIARGESNVARLAETHRLAGDCMTGDDGRATLVFTVDGREVGRATDPKGPTRFTTVALHLEAEAANTEAVFHEVTVRRDSGR
jgi:hypothetical protein